MANSTAAALLRSAWRNPLGRSLIARLRQFANAGPRVPYSSFAEARRAKASKPIGYEHCKADSYAAFTTSLIPGDYPAMFWLQQLLPHARTLFDFGGNTGLQFYSYSNYLALPPDLAWTVCDIEPFVSEGKRLALERGVSQLRFTYDLAGGDDTGIMLVSGALHYLEDSFAARLAKLSRPPGHLIINRTPLIDGPDTITLQDIGQVYIPVAIRNRDSFVGSFEAIGYRLKDTWSVEELQLTLPLYPDRSAYSYTGLYFVRA